MKVACLLCAQGTRLSVSRATLSLPGCVSCLSADTDTVCAPLAKETESLKGPVPARVHTGHKLSH